MKKLALIFSILVFKISATETKIWTVDSKEEILQGRAFGVSIKENGSISIAPRLHKVFESNELYVWSMTSDSSGNIYIGTGTEGKVFKIDATGKATLIADMTEKNITALAVGKNGELFVATSPDGKVYRIDSTGKSSVFFEPKEKYIWSLAVLLNGSLAVGTGEKARIYVVSESNADPEKSILFKSNESHIICLTTDAQGNLYAGTDPSGLVIKITQNGKPFALLDSPLREIHDISVASDGSIYALALSESVATEQKSLPTDVTKTLPQTTEMQTQIEKPTKSRYDFTSAKSVVYKILPEGNNVVIWNSSVTAFSILATSNGVFIGTSDKGRIYASDDEGNESVVLETGENQVSKLKAVGNKIFAASSSKVNLYSFVESEKLNEGIYESRILDAKSVALWGRIWWRASGNLTIQTRSGNSEKPDETWTDWTTITDLNSSQIQNPRSRFFQWRAILRSNAMLYQVNISYLPLNIAPEILLVEVLPPNVGLAPNPIPPIDPNIESSGIDPQIFGIPVQNVPPRRIYQRGARALQWRAEDRNGDKLTFSIYYKEINESEFKLLAENISDNFYTIDGLSLSDGRYVFKVVATDLSSNPPEKSLKAEKLTEIVEIDNSAPTIKEIEKKVTGNKARVTFEASDASYIIRAEYSVNGGQWQKVYPEDGISDSPSERYTIEINLDTKETTLTLKAIDSNGNSGSKKAIILK
ncbi:MAG: hypothetical protein RML33_02615 [Acidobacteriota bacterium]|nr:hypothetical protein [Pyrinomonadaceae bacterium]MDW8303713.1 hypothetical protein [Acidobacteriota bacterium]